MGEARRRATAGVWGGRSWGRQGQKWTCRPLPALPPTGHLPGAVAPPASPAAGAQVPVSKSVWLCDRGGSTGHCRVAPGWDAV